MKAIARMFFSMSAYGLASYLVFGSDRAMILMCAKVYAIHVLIIVGVVIASLAFGGRMRLLARIIIGSVAFALASCIVFGAERAVLLECFKLYAVYISIIVLIASAMTLLETFK